jgi:shikimate dehydrogenase
MSDRYAVIGNPVAHSQSPLIHAEFARATGQDIEYTRIEAPLDGFAQAIARFRAAGGRGLNVTVPFKQQAFAFCKHSSERARVAAVANTLVLDRSFADNTDGVGLVRDFTANLGLSLQGKRLLLLGAGGAAQAVVGALLEAGIAELTIVNRTLQRARDLAARFPGSRACSYDVLVDRPFDIVVNATSAGLANESPPLPAGVLGSHVLAYDMVYGRETPFLAAARAAGARASDGLGMLVEQAAESFFVWRGVHPATRPVLEKLRGA